MGKEQNSKYYDDIFETSTVYSKDPEETPYYKLWNGAVELIKKIDPIYIIDLGCGPGHVEQLLKKQNGLKMKKCVGYDFSTVAINQCIAKFKNNAKFVFRNSDLTKINIVNDLKKLGIIVDKHETLFITFEFLEHINEDIKILSQLPPKSRIIFSVPSYDSAGHVRYFENVDEIHNRYDSILNIYDIIIISMNEYTGSKIFLCQAYKK